MNKDDARRKREGLLSADADTRRWDIVKAGTVADALILDPVKRRKGRRAVLMVDPFTLPFSTVDYVFAVIASWGNCGFYIVTCCPITVDRYMASVNRRSSGAAERYEKHMRTHFKKYKREFLEGYSLPAPPTPQLRVIYDSAAKRERRPGNPCGTTLWSGFSGGEYHWRKWPLHNVRIYQ